MVLSDVLSPSSRSRETAVLIQYTLATPWLPFLHAIISASGATVVCVCICNPPPTIIPTSLQHERVHVIDRTLNIPGYEGEEGGRDQEKLNAEVQSAIENGVWLQLAVVHT